MNIISGFSNSLFVYTCVIRLFSIALFLTALEFLVIIRQFGGGGIYAWRLVKFIVYAPLRKISPDFLFHQPGVLIILLIRLVCSVCLFIYPVWDGTVYLLALIVITAFLLTIRIPIGNDGSDQMSLILGISLLIAFLFHTPAIAALSLYFIGTQSIISYVIAGTSKMLSQKWRSGVAIYQIMNTESYGSERIAGCLRRFSPAMIASVSWSVMLFESLFFMIALLPYPWLFIFLAWGIVFHVINAIIMGLNNFFWVFLATYPAILFTNLALRHYLGWG